MRYFAAALLAGATTLAFGIATPAVAQSKGKAAKADESWSVEAPKGAVLKQVPIKTDEALSLLKALAAESGGKAPKRAVKKKAQRKSPTKAAKATKKTSKQSSKKAAKATKRTSKKRSPRR